MSKLELLEEVRTLASGTVLSVCRTSGVKIKGTYEDVERVVEDWCDFEECYSDTTKKDWIESWNEYVEELIRDKDRLNRLINN